MKKERPVKRKYRISERTVRFAILGAMFALNFILFLFLVSYGSKSVWIYALLEALGVIVTVILLARIDNPAYKTAWIVVIMAFPIFGICIYLLFGANSLKKADMQRLARIEKKHAPDTNVTALENLCDDAKNSCAPTQAKYLVNAAGANVFSHTETKYYPLGELLFDDMLDALRSAEKFVFLEYFIIEKGVMWDSILEILIEKAKAGVDVRVIYDDMGCMFTLSQKYPKILRALGIKCLVFKRVRPVLSSAFNNRDHRKICVVDGKIAFTGGINLADEYINKKERFGHWLDCGVRLCGDAAVGFTAMFLSMWEYLSLKKCDSSKFILPPETFENYVGDGAVIPYADSPCDDRQIGEDAYINLISGAKRYVYICTPYVALGYSMLSSLCRAATAGVDVRIMTPGIPDKPPIHTLSRSYYESLLASGVKIYEYSPGFIHSKTFVCDDEIAICGTINLDFRSLCLHHECAVWMYKSSAVADIKESFISNLEKCECISLEKCKKTPFYKKCLQLVLRVFSPLL